MNHRRPFVLSTLLFACSLLVLCALPSAAHGQSATATLSGTVVDQNGAVVPSAEITVENISTALKRQATTNDQGDFTIVLLPPATYTVTAQRTGFAPLRIENVVLNVGDQKSLQIQLKAGNVSEMVKVTADAPLINESPAVGTTVDRQFVENIPLNGRSFQTLIALAPGVVVTKTTFNEQGQFNVNGQRANANYFMVDGVSANAGVSAGFNLVQSAGGALPAFSAGGGTNSLVSVDAMQEFKIQTSTFAPEFGRTPGAQVQILTRSGTNDFHGTLFEYFRNDALDANDWFANSRRQPKPALRQNDFGGVLGGPLYLPRFGEGGPAIYSGKNRTFFFFSYEGLRLRLPLTQVTLVPSVAPRQDAVPQTQPFLNAYPIPNGQGFANGFAEFNASYSDPLTLDATSIRVDHTFSDKLTLFGRYNHSPSETTQRGVSGRSLNNLAESRFKTQTLTVGATQSFTQTLINEIRANYSRSEGGTIYSIDEFGGAVPPPDSLLFPSFTTREDALFSFGISPGRALVIGKNVGNVQRQINLIDNLSVVAGAHQLKFGVDYRLLLPVNGPRTYDQSVNFSGLTGVTGAIGGTARSASVGSNEVVSLRFTNFSAYAQDTWKATSRFTLTYGLRWDVNPAPKGRNGKDLFVLETPVNPAALRFTPQGTPLFETTYDNFAPRVGAAYQLFQKQGLETVLRGGFGIFYDLGSGSLGNASASFPYTRSKSFSIVPFPLTTAQAAPIPFSLNIPASGTSYAADPNLKLPRTYQWNFAVEQSLGSDQTFSASYIGAIGRRLLRQTTLVSPTFFFISFTDNEGTSDYHAMQLQFQRRLSRGFQALASYTWSHSIDNASNDSFIFTPVTPDIDRASSDFDVRHAFNAAVTYDIPMPKMGKIAAALLKNWSVDAIVVARSATPVDIFAAQDFSGGFQTFLRPNLIPGVPLYIDDPAAPGGRIFNNTTYTVVDNPRLLAAGCRKVARDPGDPPTTPIGPAKGAFCTPSAGRQGNLGRNVLRGFPVFQVDLALRRQFSLTERLKLQLRAEAFNIFNHPNFGDPGGFQGNFLPSPFFGQSTSMLGRSLGSGGTSGGFNPLYQIGSPRSIQLALKVQF